MTLSQAPTVTSGATTTYQQLVSEIKFVIHHFDYEFNSAEIGDTYLIDTQSHHYQITFCDDVEGIQLIKIPYIEMDGDIALNEDAMEMIVVEKFTEFVCLIV
ncbi:MAG: hypothetical protein QNJ68_02780 [Microcoleaceae cyanobacterium MO_207.B10]|nr:hypothetical protein [Microcoleaceae cyanobacterium MO_207.B10]